MNRESLEQIFPKRIPVCDHPVGMQIFRTRIFESYGKAEERHANALMRSLFFSIPMEALEPYPVRTMAGLVYLAASMNRLPHRWHIEYLSEKWFMHAKDANLSPDAPPGAPPALLITECRVVVDEWKEIPGREKIDVLVTNKEDDDGRRHK